MTNHRRTKIEILAVGSEMLTPYHLDTDSLFLTRHLNQLGFRVSYKTVVGDDPDDLAACIRTAMKRSDVIFFIGGLGPTQDDRTREVLASALEKGLIFQEHLWDQIQDRFRRRGISISDVNRKQAFIIEGSDPLENLNGTAPGLWLEAGGRTIVLLPGPPRELEPMVLNQILPRLRGMREGFQIRRMLKLAGVSESRIEDRISDLYPVDSQDFDMTVLASPGQIDIHLTAFSELSEDDAEQKLMRPVDAMIERLGEDVFTVRDEELEDVIGNLLSKEGATLAVAESCTGGLLGHRITNVSGSSAYFLEGVQSYSNEAKIRLLGVPPSFLKNHGAVSPEVAAAMADNIRAGSGATYGLSITGIAGPTGGSKIKPVGLVYISLAGPDETQTEKNLFLGDRITVKQRASQSALDMLRRRLQRSQRGTAP
ncbi:MAG: competence/damage-inducible protein A [Candidatus Aminicenantaceae bacterium]